MGRSAVLKFSFIYFQREGKGGRQRGRETLMWDRVIEWLSLVCTLTGDQICNLGMCPDQESSPQPFALWKDTQPTEPYRSGQENALLIGGVGNVSLRRWHLNKDVEEVRKEAYRYGGRMFRQRKQLRQKSWRVVGPGSWPAWLETRLQSESSHLTSVSHLPSLNLSCVLWKSRATNA